MESSRTSTPHPRPGQNTTTTTTVLEANDFVVTTPPSRTAPVPAASSRPAPLRTSPLPTIKHGVAATSAASSASGHCPRAAPRNSNNGSGFAASAANTSALRVTCCRCRRSFIVSPDAHRSALPKHSSWVHNTPTGLPNLCLQASPSHAAEYTVNGEDSSPASPKQAALSMAAAASPQLSSTLTPALQAAVRHSYKTCGSGQRYRPLVPPGASILTSGAHKAAGASPETLGEQRALLDALHSEFFSPAEILTNAQLTGLLTCAQQPLHLDAQGTLRGTPCALASPKSLCSFAQTHSLYVSPISLPTRASTDECRLQRGDVEYTQHSSMTEAVVSHFEGTSLTALELPQLSAYGVPTQASSFTSTERTEGTEVKAAPQSIAQVKACSRLSSSSDHSDSRPSDLTAVETLAMSADEDSHASSHGRKVTPGRTPLCHQLQENNNERKEAGASDTFTDAPDAISVTLSTSEAAACINRCSLATTQAPCPILEKNPSVCPASNSSTARTTLPFDELYRRWVRLLARSSSTLHAQPLCLDCWSEACITPLQQRTKNALEGIETLQSALHCHSDDEQSRLWTLVSTATTAANTGMGLDLPRGNEDGTWHPSGKTDAVPLATSSPCPPSLSLAAVAANLCGARANEWLDTMTALSAPHRQRKSEAPLYTEPALRPAEPTETSGGACASDEIRCSAVDPETPANFDGQHHSPVPQQQYAELRALVLELEEVSARQASLDANISELRGVLQALDTTAVGTASPSQAEFDKDNTDAEEPQGRSPAPGSTTESNAVASWTKIAVALNIREVQAAFTSRDEAAERWHAMHDLTARYAFLSATPIDALCFPVDVTGPMGTIVGLRLGLVPPYPRSASDGATAHRSSQLHQKLHNSGMNQDGIHSDTACSEGVEEAVCLKGFVRRQVQYTQLLLSGHTTDMNVDPLEKKNTNETSVDASPALSSNDSVVHQRVSLGEVNAACGYLLLLLNYLAYVNGFSFKAAILRPAGDRSTVALLKRTAKDAQKGNGSAAAAAASTTPASAFATPFRFLGLFTNPPVSTENFNDKHASFAAAAARSSSRASGTVDYEVDFHITDRFFAWRTFGAACVAVAACVRELSDALHESLRCWRLREHMMRQHRQEEAVESTDTVAAAQTSNGDGTSGREARSHCVRWIAPLSLPQLTEALEQSAPVRSTTAGVDDPEAATPTTPTATGASPTQAATTSAFPLHPPYRILHDTVDGFSVRHGSVSEAIWTLGMKKLLANVQWCTEATVELERLYAVAGEGDASDVDEF
ncbi:hypothetical protein ABL78_0232 [Leptomonas seymouri]|uniref:Uncharacterized protein n=1 Tax=Leptomonas seymouri TaxID=5684 RepID=A0A0N0P929_LEPSE|nr:hypothetical protein ABL78_0232 [Leptomonas seymouri]|eukprot:KPI90636.1 hypothetical protein ABL78_0232 [Leptomonas seymouri]